MATRRENPGDNDEDREDDFNNESDGSKRDSDRSYSSSRSGRRGRRNKDSDSDKSDPSRRLSSESGRRGRLFERNSGSNDENGRFSSLKKNDSDSKNSGETRNNSRKSNVNSNSETRGGKRAMTDGGRDTGETRNNSRKSNVNSKRNSGRGSNSVNSSRNDRASNSKKSRGSESGAVKGPSGKKKGHKGNVSSGETRNNPNASSNTGSKKNKTFISEENNERLDKGKETVDEAAEYKEDFDKIRAGAQNPTGSLKSELIEIAVLALMVPINFVDLETFNLLAYLGISPLTKIPGVRKPQTKKQLISDLLWNIDIPIEIAMIISSGGTLSAMAGLPEPTDLMDKETWKLLKKVGRLLKRLRRWIRDKKKVDKGDIKSKARNIPLILFGAFLNLINFPIDVITWPIDKMGELFGSSEPEGEESNSSSVPPNSNNEVRGGKRAVTDGGRDIGDDNSEERSPEDRRRADDFQPIEYEEDEGRLSRLGSKLGIGGGGGSSNQTTPQRTSDRSKFSKNGSNGGNDEGGHSLSKFIVIFLLLAIILVPMMGFVGIPGLPGSGGGSDSGGGFSPGAWLPYLGNQAEDQTAGVEETSTALQKAANTYNKAKARVFCLLRGPACLRQWQLNQTTRPGSTEVGQQYGLNIERFSVGQGDQVNIAYKDANYALPVSFSISNPRRGLKGINALNVSYRIRVIDGENDLDSPLCNTSWVPVDSGYDIQDEPNMEDYKNDIYPGTTASTSFLLLKDDTASGDDSRTVPGDGITLRNCGMLQPALGETKTVVLDLKYDYFSQATLYFEAMARENFQSNPDLQKEWKNSETADTPATAAINVFEPVLYSTQGGDNGDQNSGNYEPQPFQFRATVNTDEADVKYKIKGLEVINSRQTAPVSNSPCSFDDTNKERVYELNDDTKPVIIPPENPDRPKSYYWFDSGNKPPLVGCTMELSEPSKISPTGETLSFGVRANYSIQKQERLGSFKVYNSACSTIECPLLVPLQDDVPGYDEYNFKATCSGADAGNGCAVLDNVDGNWGQNHYSNPDNIKIIESGEVAIRIGKLGGVSSGTWEGLDPNFDGEIDDIDVDRNYTLVNEELEGEEGYDLSLSSRLLKEEDLTDSENTINKWCSDGEKKVSCSNFGVTSGSDSTSDSTNSDSTTDGGSEEVTCSELGATECTEESSCSWSSGLNYCTSN